MITASLWQRPAVAADNNASSSWSLLSSHGAGGQRYGNRFQHILDDFDRNDAQSNDKKSTTSVDALALNDLQNELRRLKRPLRVLIHQLEPHGPPTTAPTPVPPVDTSTINQNVATPEEATIPESPPSPVMHRLVYHQKWARDKTIFVTLVASLVDSKVGAEVPMCARIIDLLFKNAANPSQIRVGVVEVHPDEANFTAITPLSGCINPIHAQCNQSKFCLTDFVRVRRVTDSSVPAEWDRFALSASMYRNEAYVLLSNSWQHLAVVGSTIPSLPKRWDEEMIHTLSQQKGGARKALTAWLPRSSSSSTTSSGPSSTFPCSISHHNGQWNVTLGSTTSASSDTAATSPRRTHLVSTDLLFAPGEMLVNVPLDSSIHSASDTIVSLALSLRLFAAGYHSYTLGRGVLPVCSQEGGLCAVIPSAHRHGDSQEGYVNEILSRGWDEPSNTTATTLNSRFSANKKAHDKFWKALAFHDNAGTQCS
ncbi:glycosyltransferase (GlcNAc), putative [Bodo saltans]|uniref:Glycosyltransferase (GlcNAc), putative n=1 Tax=Bodo saltans TaxID=75058 RepID=A0A0S4J2L2_BODSA|nr:glycosyltransferase (GlcNAc), putative [Bodo saltans]|eukprot:CUG57980.1 glycosyltransferase (GlcNAc), putative [Bodo saltans]